MEMGKIKNIYFIIIFLVILSSFLLLVTISVKNIGPVGTDFYFHIRIAEAYSRGEVAMFREDFFGVNNFPYPPLFHIMLVPSIWLGLKIPFGVLLQLIFYPLAVIFTVFLVWKEKGEKYAAFTCVLLFSSLGLFDRAGQVTPQAFDMIFFPIAAYFFLKRKTIPFVLSVAIIVYSHSPISLLLFGSLILYQLSSRSISRPVILALMVSLPMILITLFYMPNLFGTGSQGLFTIQNQQEELMLKNPLFFFEYMGYLPSILIPFAAYHFLKRKKTFKLDVLALFWILCLLPLIVPWPDRFATYAIVPLSIITPNFIVHYLRGKHLKLALIAFFFASYFGMFLTISLVML